jgi:hypothetical protein
MLVTRIMEKMVPGDDVTRAYLGEFPMCDWVSENPSPVRGCTSAKKFWSYAKTSLIPRSIALEEFS